MRLILSMCLTVFVAGLALAEDAYVVHPTDVADRKAVVATVEPVHQLVARARIGGTIASLAVKEGDTVAAGTQIALVADEKLALQMQALDARISSQQSQRDQARTDYDRIAELAEAGRQQPDPTRPGQDQSRRRRAQPCGDAVRPRRRRATGE